MLWCGLAGKQERIPTPLRCSKQRGVLSKTRHARVRSCISPRGGGASCSEREVDGSADGNGMDNPRQRIKEDYTSLRGEGARHLY